MERSKKNSRDWMVSRFQDVVQQEITNHNRQILATNMAYNDLEKGFSKLSSDLAKSIAVSEMKFRRYEKLFDDKDCSLLKFYHEAKNELDTIHRSLENRVDKLDTELENLTDTIVEKEEFVEKIDEIHITLNEFRNSIEDQKVFLTSTLSTIREHLERCMKDFIKEIRDKPSEFIEIHKDLERRLSESKVDTEGVTRKLNVYGKSIYILEKNIEEIHNRLSKLKK